MTVEFKSELEQMLGGYVKDKSLEFDGKDYVSLVDILKLFSAQGYKNKSQEKNNLNYRLRYGGLKEYFKKYFTIIKYNSLNKLLVQTSDVKELLEKTILISGIEDMVVFPKYITQNLISYAENAKHKPIRKKQKMLCLSWKRCV